MAGLVSVPPFGIREPGPTYADGSPREDGEKEREKREESGRR